MKHYDALKRCVWIWLAVVVLVIPALTGCVSQDVGPSEDKLHVTVSILPQRYFVERIGGARVSVNVMVVPGESPATYEPKPEQLKALSRSSAYFSIGVPFESVWLGKIAEANKNMRVVDTIANIERMSMEAHHHGEEDDETEHSEGAPDPHVWVSPELVRVQAQAIYDALVELDPEHKDVYAANLEVFIEDIDALEADIKKTLSGLDSRKFMVFHPAWGYFAHDFGLEQVPIEVGGQEPSAQELAELIEHAREEGIRVVFAQPEFSTQDAEMIAQEINGEVLLIGPLAPDWLANMRGVAQTFAEVLKEK